MLRRMLCALLVFACLACAPSALSADAPQTIRVACWERGGRMSALEDGVARGYDVALIERIADEGGFTVAYVPVDGLNDALAALDAGKVDVVTSINKTAEREEKYLFGSLSTSLVIIGLIAKDDRDDLVYKDADAIDRCLIGYEAGTGVTEGCLRHCAEHYPGARLKPYTSVAALQEALAAGDIDVMAAGANNLRDGQKLLDRFEPGEVFYISTPDKARLMRRLDDAFLGVVTNTPDYVSELQKRFFPMYYDRIFSKRQMDFAAAHRPLTVGVPFDRKPICWYDEATGRFTGVIIDLLDAVANKAGLRFQYESYDYGTATSEGIESGRFDLVAPQPAELPLSGRYLLSDSFLETYVNLGVLEGNALDMVGTLRIGLTHEAKGLAALAAQAYPNAAFTFYNTQLELLAALERGEIDALLNSTLVFYYLRQNPAFQKVTLLPSFAMQISYCISAGNVNASRELFDLLDVAVRQLSEMETSVAVSKYTSMQLYERTLLDDVRENLLVYCLALGVIAVLIAFIWQRNRYYRDVERRSLRTQEDMKAKALFFSQVSHDLRVPMNAVLGFTRLARDEPDVPPTVRDYLAKIQTSGDHLLDLVNDVLDVTKIENARLELVEEPTNGLDYLHDMLDSVRKDAATNDITIAASFDLGDTPWVYIDRLRMRQVFENLLSNAIKYSPPGTTVEWTVRHEPIDAERVTTIVVIRDEGCGMSEAFMERMFLPFEQELNEYSGRRASSGLGLAIVKHLVEMMSGTIDVQSALGQGTTFTLRIPRRVAEPPATDPQPRKAPVADLSSRRALVCEDQSLNQQIAQLLLEKRGMAVDFASNGQLGVNAFANARPGYYDVILMDVRMPVMDGLEATRLIRALDRPDARVVPIVAMTGNAFSEDVSASLEAGMDAHLSKPIDPEALYDAIASLIS